MEFGTFTIFQWNGKDLFLKTKEDFFTVLSHQELPAEAFPLIQVGRQVTLRDNGGGWTEIKITVIKTPEEKAEEQARNARHANILRDIASLESMGENTLPPYALNKLNALRKELEFYEPLDPTAITLAQKRSNASVASTKMFLKKCQ